MVDQKLNPAKVNNQSLRKVPGRKRATILQATGGYVITGITIIQGLVLVPMYLYYLGAHTYGLWLASGGILGMLGVMNFGIGSMLVQRIASAYGRQELQLAGAYFINGMVVYAGIALLMGGVGWSLSFWLSDILTEVGETSLLLRQCFQLAVLVVTMGVMNECLRSFSQALLRPVVPIVGIAGGKIIGIGVTVWMLFAGFGLWAIPTGLLVAECIVLLVNLFSVCSLLRKFEMRIKGSIKKKILTEYLQTSPVLLMATVGNRLSKEADPLIITMFLGPEVTTAYMLTRRAADIVSRMLSVIVGSTMGTFSHLIAGNNPKKVRDVASKLLALSFSLGVIGFATYLGTNEAFVSLWVGGSLMLSQNVMFFIALGFLARSFRSLAGQMLYGFGDFTYTSTIILIEGMGRIFAAVVFLHLFGVIGVPLAFFLSCLVTIFVLGIRLKNKLVVQLQLSSIAKYLFSGLFCFAGAMSVLQAKVSVESWPMFFIYLLFILTGISVVYLCINMKTCCETYRNIVK